jgi:outer membrane protein assembly factor BamB
VQVIAPGELKQGVMRSPLLFAALLLGVFAPPGAFPRPKPPAPAPAGWPSFRGPAASGIDDGAPTPATWNVEEGKNVLWKTPIPGMGHSSPVVWGNRLWVTSAIRKEGDAPLKPGLYGDIAPVEDDSTYRWQVYCLDRRSGKILWERTACEGVPKIRRHPKATHANPSVATDGKRVIAFFGSEGLYCYSVEGKLLWKKDLGVLDAGFFLVPAAQWGFGSSPIIDGEKVIVQCDVQKDPFLAAFRITDGQEIWRTPRDDVPTWSTPTVVREGGRAQVIVNGYRHVGGYDTATGKELWRLKGGGDIPVPTPVAGHGLVFITNAHGRMAPIYAIRTNAAGDISLPEDQDTNQFVAWSRPRDGSYMQTPLVYGDCLYVCRWNGILSCYEAQTGKQLYDERLGSGTTAFTASPVAAKGLIYLPSEDGDVHVVRAGPQFQSLGVNSLGEVCLATPAISAGTLYFRTRDHLVAIGSRRKGGG